MKNETKEKSARQRKTATQHYADAFDKLIKALELRKQELFDEGNMTALPEIQAMLEKIHASGQVELCVIKKMIGGL